MAEKTKRKPRAAKSAPPAQRSRAGDDSERSLGRGVALGLPLLSVLAALAVGVLGSVGSALLVLAAGTLLGAIALLWASVRTLSGDAPLSRSLEEAIVRTRGVDDLDEQKRRLLRALKDLESEHALGKIDDADFAAIDATYRDEAKRVMREMDVVVAPAIEEAERVAAEYLAKRASPDAAPKEDAPVVADVAPAPPTERATCASCGTSNEADATFCKQCGASMKRTRAEKADAAT
jgi:hypothetical protein